MVNYIWMFFIGIGIIYAIINGKVEDVTKAIFASSTEAVTISIGFISVFVFWLGMMKIAEETGILRWIAKGLKPLVQKIFPEIPKNHPVHGTIVANITANMFGLGNAATPLGIKAMKQMKDLHQKKEASRSMITFLAINTSGLTIFPTTIVAIRMQYGAMDATDIVLATLIATCMSTLFALIFDRLFHALDRLKRDKQ